MLQVLRYLCSENISGECWLFTSGPYLHTSLPLENMEARMTSGAIQAYVPAALILVVRCHSRARPKSVIFRTLLLRSPFSTFWRISTGQGKEYRKKPESLHLSQETIQYRALLPSSGPLLQTPWCGYHGWKVEPPSLNSSDVLILVPGILQALSSTLTTTLWGRYYCHGHSTDEETAVPLNKFSKVTRLISQDWNPGSLTREPPLLPWHRRAPSHPGTEEQGSQLTLLRRSSPGLLSLSGCSPLSNHQVWRCLLDF